MHRPLFALNYNDSERPGIGALREIEIERQRERQRLRERQTDRQSKRETVSNLVFYAQSTITVISGRERDRQTDR